MSSPFSRGLHFCRTRRTSYTMEGFCLLYLLMILLMRSGDVETNPGPNTAESVFSYINYMKLAKDIPPSYYYDVGRSLGFSNAELRKHLVRSEINYTHALNSVFKLWNYLQQSPHSNKRQLLADALREIDSGRLSDRILHELPMQNSTAVLNAGRPQTEPLMDFKPSPSTVCEMEFVDLAEDIPPSLYTAVGISLGIPSAQLPAILDMDDMNYIRAFMHVFMQWIMQQPPHSNKRQLLADKLREIDLGDLSDRLLNELPNKTALLIYTVAKWKTDIGMAEPARCTPSTSGQTWSRKDELGGVIINVADALSDDGLRKLGVELGVHFSDINRALIANYPGASKESNVLCDRYFSDLAVEIGAEWQQLGYQLQLRKADIEQIIEDKHIPVDRRVALLQMWKNRSSCTDKRMVEELCEALSSCACGRSDLAEKVKKDAGIS